MLKFSNASETFRRFEIPSIKYFKNIQLEQNRGCSHSFIQISVFILSIFHRHWGYLYDIFKSTKWRFILSRFEERKAYECEKLRVILSV